MATAQSKVKCVRCGQIRALGACDNCGGTSYIRFGYSGFECTKCKQWFTEWTCSCGTKNPGQETLVDKCFIATAVYGYGMSPNVIALRNFRDIKLKGNFIGEKFISFYEKASPPLADWIITRPAAKTFVRRFVLSPIVWVIRYWSK